MRGFVKLTALFLVLTTSVFWSNLPDPFDDPLHVQSAVAQPPAPGLTGPGGVIFYTASSASAVNTAASVNLFDYTLPAAFVATSSFISVTGTTTTTNVVAASVPIHLRCNGRLVNAANVLNVGVSFGPQGGTNPAVMASISLISGVTMIANAAPGVPLMFDAWIAPVATSVTPTSTDVFMNARVAWGVGTLATEVVYNGLAYGNVNLGLPNQLRVQWMFTTASNGNSAVFQNCVLGQGY